MTMPDGTALAPVTVVSPHLDDAVLSCAGLIAGAPTTTVLTVFAGRPPARDTATPPEFVPGSTFWDQASGFVAGDDVVGLRRAEDRAALAQLGALPRWLDFLDSQYVVEPGESAGPRDIAAAVRAAIGELRPATIAFPLGLEHTDHERTHEACFLLLNESPELATNWIAFIDVPYRARYRAQADLRIARLRELGYELEPLSFDPGERKIAALDEYPSQLKALAESTANAALPEECFLLRR
ncbi:MAG TPA: PIG-L family deacetylase [Acidothermaceae bacterium]|nr:PIG-L family deacetylase [Acidothermaceae bacterium]